MDIGDIAIDDAFSRSEVRVKILDLLKALKASKITRLELRGVRGGDDLNSILAKFPVLNCVELDPDTRGGGGRGRAIVCV